MKIMNNHGVSLPLAIWLLHDDYDYINEPNYISATSLLKPIKQLLLPRRIPLEEREVDLADLVPQRLGHAIHDSIEQAWRKSARQGLKKLGYPDAIADNVVVNPTDEEIAANPAIIPAWFERRAFRQITTMSGRTWTIGGKFDTVLQGRLFDNKSTSVWAYILGSRNEDYAMQGGIYRWLNPELIQDDHIFIQFVFTDWQRAEANRRPDYPQARVKEYPVLMPSLAETERFIVNKLQELEKYWDADEDGLPPCSDQDLWRGPTTYKYFSDPAKTDGRATRNFDSDQKAANEFLASKGGKGVIIAKAGEAKACNYCAGFEICKQKDQYFV